MTDTPVSVIIVSRGRPSLLQSCVQAVAQLYYYPFEVVVVADHAGLTALEAAKLPIRLKTTLFEEPNISKARNVGLALSSGSIVAFIDDDAVPEPGWLHHLAAVFQNPDVAAAGGYVLGRNGISVQSGAQIVDRLGISKPLKMHGTTPEVFDGSSDSAVKTEGTNCAFRRSVLQKIGGFDPSFHYFMDEIDLNIRLSQLGYKTAVVPKAVVHHNRAGSNQRNGNQMPKSLHDVGASTAVFLGKHAPKADQSAHIATARVAQRRILLRHMIAGNCEPNDIGNLLKSFDAGVVAGRQRQGAPQNPGPADPNFLPHTVELTNTSHQIIFGYRIHSSRLRAQAKSAVRPGNIVSLYIFSRTALYHKVRFHPDGYWEQTGGLFGRSLRSESLFHATKLAERVSKEDLRIAPARHPWQILSKLQC